MPATATRTDLLLPVPPAHTHHAGPLCESWGYSPFDPPEVCDHRSCLDLVDEFCPGCEYEVWQLLDEADFH